MADSTPVIKTFKIQDATSDLVVHSLTMSFNGECTAYAWGGGGGAGGNDAGTTGGNGSSGLFNSTTFNFAIGDVIEVCVGSGGRGGLNGTSANGGIGGSSRINISGSSNLSFNGGTGGKSGNGGMSGSGGGGGGATVVLKNNNLVLVAGGGGGGGGAGNDGNSAANTTRKTATVLNNATKQSLPSSTWAINVDDNTSYNVSPYVKIDTYAAFPKMAAPPTSASKVFVFGIGGVQVGPNTRTVTSTNKVYLSTANGLTCYVNRGTETDWGQTPDSNEQLYIEYSSDGSSWPILDTVPVNIRANTWTVRSVEIPAGARGLDGVYIRFRQNTNGDSVTKRDTWAMSSIQIATPSTDYRGENGQSKSGDGGGGGGGGGGYLGGQGGATYAGDSTAFAGQCGGIYPTNRIADDGYYDDNVTLYTSQDSSRWSQFMRAHSAWPVAVEQSGTNNYTVLRVFDAPATGTYKFKFCVDNIGELFVNGTKLGDGTNFGSEPTPMSLSLSKGQHKIKLTGANYGGPAGWALTIEDAAGQTIWKLRDYLQPSKKPSGSDNRYYESPYAQGGTGTGANGRNGMAVLIFNPKANVTTNYSPPSAVKVGSSWRQITGAWVKVSGTWREIVQTYVKRNGTWYEIKSTTEVVYSMPNVTNAINFNTNGADYGSISRNYGT